MHRRRAAGAANIKLGAEVGRPFVFPQCTARAGIEAMQHIFALGMAQRVDVPIGHDHGRKPDADLRLPQSFRPSASLSASFSHGKYHRDAVRGIAASLQRLTIMAPAGG